MAAAAAGIILPQRSGKPRARKDPTTDAFYPPTPAPAFYLNPTSPRFTLIGV